VLLAVIILAGCGGSGRSKVQTVTGPGFSFQAPVAWRVATKKTSVIVSNGAVDRLEVLRFRLEKPYRVALFRAVTRELDGVVAKLAAQLKGRVASRATVKIAGRRSRSYRVEYGPGKAQEIAFVLEAQTEYELLCRRPARQPDATCRAFLASFALTPAT
jgi:uncharacterized cupredoxin-like copper-binding protein